MANFINFDKDYKNRSKNEINSKYSYFDKIPFEIMETIYEYISYYDLINLKITNKKIYKSLEIYLEKYFVTKRWIEKMPRVNEHEEEIKKIINESFNKFPINTFRLHKYDHKIDLKEKELCIVVSFTFFNNNNYHDIQLIEDKDSLVNFIVYRMLEGIKLNPIFKVKVLATRIYDDDYDENGNLLFQDEYIKEIINNKDKYFKKLSEQMGFENSYLEIYEMFMNIYNYYIKNKKDINIDIFNEIFSNINNQIMDLM